MDTNANPRNSYRADCRSCKPVLLPTSPDFACLSHTCPDCGHATDAIYNDLNELTHPCCSDCTPN